MFLPLRDPLVVTLNEIRALTSRKSEAAQDISIPKSTQKYNFLRSHSSVFVLEELLIFKVCLPLKNTAANYFDWSTWIQFRKLWSLLNVPKSPKNTNYFGFTLSFCFRITASKKLIFEICLPLKKPLVVTFGETRAYTSRKCVVVQGMKVTKSSKKHKLVWLHSPIFVLE